jgi:hypothetical protein
MTLAEIQAALASSGVSAALSTIHRTLQRLGLRQKKSLRAAEQDRPDVLRRRRRWRIWQRHMDAGHFLFLDARAPEAIEATATNMARRYGRCPAGRRLVASMPHGHVWTPPRAQEESLGQVLCVIGCCHVSGLGCGTDDGRGPV